MTLAVIDDRVNDRIGPINLAHELAKRGEKLLPMWWIEDNGLCACGDGEHCKEPGEHIIDILVPNGLGDATDRILTINKWFRIYPKSSIGSIGANGCAQIIDIKDIGLARKNIPNPRFIDHEGIIRSSRTVDLAREFIRIISPNHSLIRSVGSDIYTYSERLGIWMQLSEKDIKSSIQEELHGKPYVKTTGGGERETGYLDMHPQKRNAIYDAMVHERSICDSSFFADAPAGITFTNGWLDASDMLIKPHSPDQRSRASMDFAYDNEEECVFFDEFMSQLFEHDPDKEKKINLLQEFYGAAVFGKCPSFQKSLLLYGEQASNGKSTFVEVMTRCLFPKGTAASVRPKDWGIDYYAKTLDGALINHTGELGMSSFTDSETFKGMVTGKHIQVCGKYKDPYYMAPTAGHVFESNVRPRVNEVSNGFWRRIIFITFNTRFKEGDFDSLVARLAKNKVGIMSWAIRGAQRLFARGHYDVPASHVDYIEAWQSETNSVYSFVKTACREELTGTTKGNELYDAYLAYCEFSREQEKPVGMREFVRRLLLIKQTTKIRDGYKLYPFSLLQKDHWRMQI